MNNKSYLVSGGHDTKEILIENMSIQNEIVKYGEIFESFIGKVED